MAKGKLSIRDNNRELTRTEVNIPAFTVDSIGQTLTDWGAYKTATAAIVEGVLAKEALILDETNLSAAAPTSPTAQRGIKWSVQYADITQFFDPPVNAIPNAGYQEIFTNTLGTAKLSLLADGVEDLDLTAGAGLAYKTAFDKIVRSPYGGRVSLLRVYYSD